MSRSRGTGDVSLAGHTILMLEDESLIVLDLTLALEADGAQVLAAADVAGALHFVETRRIDAAVLDLTLTGGESCEPVAARLASLRIPYLLHTGDVPRHEPLLARLGVPVLIKPFPSHRIGERITRLLRSGEVR